MLRAAIKLAKLGRFCTRREHHKTSTCRTRYTYNGMSDAYMKKKQKNHPYRTATIGGMIACVLLDATYKEASNKTHIIIYPIVNVRQGAVSQQISFAFAMNRYVKDE